MKFAIAAVVILVGSVAGCVLLVAESTAPHPVGDRATFEESADCLVHDADALSSGDWRLHAERVDDCFPRQTAATRQALIACFNEYEHSHPNHKGWPEANMRGCAWSRVAVLP